MGISATAPVLVSVTVCALLLIPKACVPKSSDVGFTVAVVNCEPPVNSGISHTPRPYVAAASTFSEPVTGAALSATTGASGNPVPYANQQLMALSPQFATRCVA